MSKRCHLATGYHVLARGEIVMPTKIRVAMLLSVVLVCGGAPGSGKGQRSNAQPRNQFLFRFGDMITESAPRGELIHILGGESHGFESLSFVISETKPNGGPPLHRHLCEEAHVLLAGRVKYTIGHETFVAEAPYVVRIPAGVCHSFENLGDKTINVIGVFPKSRENEVDPPNGPRC